MFVPEKVKSMGNIDILKLFLFDSTLSKKIKIKSLKKQYRICKYKRKINVIVWTWDIE